MSLALAAAVLLLTAPASPESPGRAQPAAGPRLSGSALDAKTEDVASLLRCPVCQGLSVAASGSTMARNMKAQVREKLAAGYDQDQIVADFERSYGEFVRLEPPMRGVNWLVWLGPAAALIAGALVVVSTLKRSAKPLPAPLAAVPLRDTLPDDGTLAAAVLRVRQLAYGWPGGVVPRGPGSSP